MSEKDRIEEIRKEVNDPHLDWGCRRETAKFLLSRLDFYIAYAEQCHKNREEDIQILRKLKAALAAREETIMDYVLFLEKRATFYKEYRELVEAVEDAIGELEYSSLNGDLVLKDLKAALAKAKEGR